MAANKSSKVSSSKKSAKVVEEVPAVVESPTRVSRRSAPAQIAKKASPSPSPAPKALKKKGKMTGF